MGFITYPAHINALVSLVSFGVSGIYLAVMIINVVYPSGLASPRGYFNLDWITLLVMVVIGAVGALYFLLSRPDRRIGKRLGVPAPGEAEGAQTNAPADGREEAQA